MGQSRQAAAVNGATTRGSRAAAARLDAKVTTGSRADDRPSLSSVLYIDPRPPRGTPPLIESGDTDACTVPKTNAARVSPGEMGPALVEGSWEDGQDDRRLEAAARVFIGALQGRVRRVRDGACSL